MVELPPVNMRTFFGGNQVDPMVQMFQLMMQFSKMTNHPYTQPEVFGLGLMSMEMNVNTFPGQHNRQTCISSNHCGRLERVV